MVIVVMGNPQLLIIDNPYLHHTSAYSFVTYGTVSSKNPIGLAVFSNHCPKKPTTSRYLEKFPGPLRSRVLSTFFTQLPAKNLIPCKCITCYTVTLIPNHLLQWYPA